MGGKKCQLRDESPAIVVSFRKEYSGIVTVSGCFLRQYLATVAALANRKIVDRVRAS